MTIPPPPVMLLDPTTTTVVTDGERRCVFVNIPGYGRYTPAQLVACLEAQEALGQARADAAALRAQLEAAQEQLGLWERCQDANVFRMLLNQRDAARDLAAMLEQELAALKARLPVLEAAAGCEGVSDEH